jgi:hypothetical protein
MNRRSFLKTNLFGAIGLASAKIAGPVSAAEEIDKSLASEVKTGGSGVSVLLITTWTMPASSPMCFA